MFCPPNPPFCHPTWWNTYLWKTMDIFCQSPKWSRAEIVSACVCVCVSWCVCKWRWTNCNTSRAVQALYNSCTRCVCGHLWMYVNLAQELRIYLLCECTRRSGVCTCVRANVRPLVFVHANTLCIRAHVSLTVAHYRVQVKNTIWDYVWQWWYKRVIYLCVYIYQYI